MPRHACRQRPARGTARRPGMAGQPLQRHAAQRSRHRPSGARCRAARWRLARRGAGRAVHRPARHRRTLPVAADDASPHGGTLAWLGGAAAPALCPRAGRGRRGARAAAMDRPCQPGRGAVGNPSVPCLGGLQHGVELARENRHGCAAASATGRGGKPYAAVPVSPAGSRPAALARRATAPAGSRRRKTRRACVETPRADAR